MNSNLFATRGLPREQEQTEVLATFPEGSRVERIVSFGHASPDGFWYDQEEYEWVMVVSGRACLRFEGPPEERVMGPGDWVVIEPHRRHRVEWTERGRETLWLALFSALPPAPVGGEAEGQGR